MEIEDRDVKMARYIWHSTLQRSFIPFSWGIDFANVKAIDHGTEFHVQGFIITGTVKIQYVEGADTFKITISPDDRQKERIVYEDVYLDQIVSLIDETVEKVENYEEAVRGEYGLVLEPKAV